MTDFMYTQMIMCAGCPKASAWTATGTTCAVYAYPDRQMAARHRVRCPFNPAKVETKKKGFVNPIKASKRRNR
jgi:hypothetical protein